MVLKYLFAGLLAAVLWAGHAEAQCVAGATTATKPPSVDANGYLMTIPCGGGATQTIKPASTTPTAIPTTTIPTTTAVLEAATISTGCDIQNVGTVPLYVSRTPPATAVSQQIVVGQSYHCPGPSTTGLSVYNASGTTAGTLAGEVY